MQEMGRFTRSWLLFKTSLSVVSNNRELLLFPIVTALLMIVIFLFFLAPVALMPTGYSLTQVEHWQTIGNRIGVEVAAGDSEKNFTFSTPALAYLVFLYLASMFLGTFFNVAFYNEILAALSGQPVSVGRGLRFAMTRLKAILMWSLLAGIVGLVIKALEERFGLIGRIVMRLIGVAWSVASVFAVPIIVRDEDATNPVQTLKKSADILRRTWGEALIGYVGVSFASGVIVLGSLVFLLIAVIASIALNSGWIIGIAAVLWFLGVLAFGYLTSVMSQVYKGALYLYAADQIVAAPYSADMFNSAWKFKKK
jgi:hypothetical protein